ncbi:TlpA family protein disulfide reductase [Polaribacter sp. Hel1_85]|uniref:TlpA family protein disulfide reductase n=1 Tax=Polaribacter sp. Hel1_85 TaxID=1250005 RepID=UPI00052C7D73|nr:TlpA disulfide reductase family protein [Polaribacter sp. Hel1_85]KGL62720.1 thiol:disulfide interchange protein [Polaribacter sp. Hel1_85]
MKNFWLLIAIATIVSCTPEKKVDYAIVSGKITNANSDKIIIYSQFNRDNKVEITLKEDGSFKDTLKMATDFYLFREDRNLTEFFAPKGSDFIIEYNASKKDSTIIISGSQKIVNNYIFDKEKMTESLRGDEKEMYLKNEADFKEHLLKIKNAQEKLLTNTNGLPEDFKNSGTKSINYEYLSALSRYQSYHGYYLKDRSFKVSDNFLDELKDLDIENEKDFIFSQGYRNLVGHKTNSTAQKLAEKDSIANDIAVLKTVSNIKSDIIRNKLLFDNAKYGITYTKNLEDFYKIYSEFSSDEKNNKKIEADYKRLKSLAKGSFSPKFTDYENNAGGTKSLNDLKGKYVYIDVWATWCGPCIAEIPSLKKVEKEFHNKNIEFVSISIDQIKDHDKWKKMIVDKELGGMQLFADNNWESKFIQDYMIKGIPRFILIDPQGKIINANAPRPSDKKLVETLQSLKL